MIIECGGYTLDIKSQKGKTYGYGKCMNPGQLMQRIIILYQKMVISAISPGCCGCIYTQLSNIEEEINGLYSSDRSIFKVDKAKLMELSGALASESGRL